MVGKTISVFVFLSYLGVQVNFVSTKTVPPSQIEPMPGMYSHATTYPDANVVNYNASPNPQYSSQNFNNFNEQMPQPSLQMPGNYQKRDFQQKPVQHEKSLEEVVTSIDPTATSYDYSSDLKNTLVSMKDNLGFMADTQRLLLNSFKVQQQQYNGIEEKLLNSESPSQRNAYAYAYGGQLSNGPTASQQPQYQSYSAPPILPLPYGQTTHTTHTVQHHKKQSPKKLLAKLLKKQKKANSRGLALLQRRSESERLQRHAAMTLTYIKNGIVNALWTALVVACVKLVPILLFGFQLMFKSVLPLTGLALFGNNRGLFPQTLKKIDDDDDDDLQLDDEDEDDDEIEVEDEDRDVNETKDASRHHYR